MTSRGDLMLRLRSHLICNTDFDSYLATQTERARGMDRMQLAGSRLLSCWRLLAKFKAAVRVSILSGTVLTVLLSAFLIAPATGSATVLPATISKNMTLTAAGNPYTGEAVTIKSGVTVNAEPGVKFLLSSLTVKGTLKSEGSAAAPVIFTGKAEKEAGEWGQIKFEAGSSASLLNYTEVRYGGFGYIEAAVEVSGASPTITHSTIANNLGAGLSATGGGKMEIAYNEVRNNGARGIRYEPLTTTSGEVNIHDNVVKANGGDGIYVTALGSSVGHSLGHNTLTANGGLGVFYSGPDIPPDVGTNTLSENSENVVSVGGTFKQSATWSTSGYRFEFGEAVTIPSAVTLTLKPGVVINARSLTVKGTLKSEGSAAAPVIFTGKAEKEAGEWGQIKFEAGSSASLLNYTEVRYGGFGYIEAAVEVSGASPTITHSTIANNLGAGLSATGGGKMEIAYNEVRNNGARGIRYEPLTTTSGEVNIHDNVVKANGGDGIYVTALGSSVGHSLGHNTLTANGGLGVFYSGPDIPPDVGTNTLSENSENVVSVGGTFKQSATWSTSGYRFEFGEAVTIPSAVTLTLKPGVVINARSLTVKGTLKSEGSAAAPVIFTGKAEKEAGEWGQIKFEAGSSASLLNYTEVRYGGFGYIEAAVEVSGASPTITHSTIANNLGAGLSATGGGKMEIAYNEVRNNGARGIRYEPLTTTSGEVNIHDNVVKANGGDGIYVTALGSSVGHSLGHNTLTANGGLGVFYSGPDIPPDVGTNTLSENSENVVSVGGTFKQSATWSTSGYRFEFGEAVTIPSAVTLTLKPGVVINARSLTVKGTLKSEGSAAAPVIFTGKAEKEAGEWGQIKFEAGSSASLLNYTEVRYGGFGYIEAAVEVSGASPTITHSTIANNLGAGLSATGGGKMEIAYNEVRNNGARGIRYEPLTTTSGEVNIHDNVVKANGGDGIYVTALGSSVGHSLGHNTLTANGGLGVFYSGPDIPPDVGTNTLSENSENVVSVGGTFKQSATWSTSGYRFEFGEAVTIPSAVTLTLKPGVVINARSLTVKGTLKSEGSAAAPVIFTGKAEKEAGEWGQIKFEAGSSASLLNYTEVRYGGFGYIEAAVEVSGASPTITHSAINHSLGSAMYVASGTPTIEWTNFTGNQGGLRYGGTGTLSAPHNYWGCACRSQTSGLRRRSQRKRQLETGCRSRRCAWPLPRG